MVFPWDSHGIHKGFDSDSGGLELPQKTACEDQLEVLGMNQTPTEQLVAVEADSVLVDDALSHVHHFGSF